MRCQKWYDLLGQRNYCRKGQNVFFETTRKPAEYHEQRHDAPGAPRCHGRRDVGRYSKSHGEHHGRQQPSSDLRFPPDAIGDVLQRVSAHETAEGDRTRYVASVETFDGDIKGERGRSFTMHVLAAPPTHVKNR